MDKNKTLRALWNQIDSSEISVSSEVLVGANSQSGLQRQFDSRNSNQNYAGARERQPKRGGTQNVQKNICNKTNPDNRNSHQFQNGSSNLNSNHRDYKQVPGQQRSNKSHYRGKQRNGPNFNLQRQDFRAHPMSQGNNLEFGGNFGSNQGNVVKDLPHRKKEIPDNHALKREIKTMSFTRLKELVNKTPSEIVLTIINSSSGFSLLLNQSMRRDLNAYVWLALGKSVTAYMSKNVNAMVNMVTSNTKFMENISSYLASFQKYSSEDYHLESLASMTDFLYKFQTTLPSSASDILIMIMPLLERTCQRFLQNSSELCSKVLEKLHDIEKQNESFIVKYEPAEIKKASEKERLHLMEPPESYRSVPTLPGIEDIHCSSAFIRPNIVDGRYQDSEHYLDVQYRLLREDYVKPLRDGIAEYLRLKKSGKSVKQCKDVRVYEGVKIVMQQFVNGGLVHLAYFNDTKFSRIKWEYSKRFLSGSLLCLTTDNFESMLFATVARRMPLELKKGLLLLRFENLSDEVLNITSHTCFTVVETTAYFEAYRHNLTALIELNEANLPMKRYIVEVEREVEVPQYLQQNTTYDMRPLLLPMDDISIKQVKDIDGNISINYEFPSSLNSKAKSINVLDDRCWPTFSELKLDHTQYLALKAAITKEFAVVQGPPGTGKTYIGLRIAQLLLHNMNKWETEANHSPILVVCYTNHALDQFLEGLLRFTQKIVRVGGRGQNEALAKFQLHNLKRIIEQKREVPHYIFSTIKQKQTELHSLKREIDGIKKIIDKTSENVLVENELKSSIPDYQYRSLNQINLKNDGQLLLDWLEIRFRASNNTNDLIDDEISDSEENCEFDDFILTDIYKKEFIDIPSNDVDCFNTDEINKLRKGKQFMQVIAQHISDIIDNCEPFSDMQANCIYNVWNLDMFHRWKLYLYWAHCFILNKQLEYTGAVKHYRLKLEDCRTDKYELLYSKQHLQLIRNTLNGSLSTILNEELLRRSIPRFHYDSLLNTNIHLENDNYIIYYWLGLKLENHNELKHRVEIIRNLKFIANHLKNIDVVADQALADGDLEIDSEGEADIDYIEAQREIDSEEFADASFDISPLLTQKLQKKNLIPNIDDGWKIKGGIKKRKKYIKNNLQNVDKMAEKEAKAVTDIWSLPMQHRWRLYKYWLQCYIEENEKETFKLQQQLRQQYEELNELRTEEDMYVCRRAHVVGMTTTGAAKYRQIVQNLNPRIIIVEEAAEILESHLVTSLAPGTQHVILIGDHQQLRPSPTVHLLSVKYDLNVSLFERMVQNGLDCHQLGIQHRMRPEIAALLVPHIYKNLENHESVTKFENIKGVNKNVFFITHCHSELQENDTKSKVNQHEAKFLLELCRYFILQGYEPSQITVLTTYSGQLFEMKRLKKKIHEGVKFTVVDNYQGEENEIILVSFVRSNEEGEIGFLKISNRVCVALSRAKKGLFCIGNFQLLADRSELWKNIISVLNNHHSVGRSLQLVCQNHPTISNVVEDSKDFDTVPEGGCTRSCEYRLLCGHACPKMCHSYDRDHMEIKCLKPCNKTCEYGHPCKNKCSEECGSCKYPVPKTINLCGHDVTVKCHQRFEKIACSKSCERLLSCGHKCLKKCGENCSLRCEQICTIKSIICGHDIEVECFHSNNIDYLLNKCTEPCRVQLSCEHMCKGTCSSCHQGRLHVLCNEKCKRILVCGHECKSRCSKSCPPCNQQCDNRCVHSKCPKKCGEPCEKCTECCEWQCRHSKCLEVCGDLCDRNPCNKPCPNILKCKHPCIGLCGEPCPKQCRICNEDEVKEIFFGSEDESDARFICLEDCNHIFEVEGIAQWMTVRNSETREIQMKACPKCKTVIRKNLRFGNIIKLCLQDIEKVKKMTYGDKKQNIILAAELAFRLENANSKLQTICRPLKKVLKSGKSRSIQEITAMDNVLNIAKIFVEAISCLDISFPGEIYSDIVIQDSIKDLKTYVEQVSSWLTSFFQDDYLTASEQQLQELTWEVHRLKLANQLFRFIEKRKGMKCDSHFLNLVKCIMTYSPFREAGVQVFSNEFKLLSEKLGSAVINVSDMEKQDILKAMRLASGHWYQCPRGHVYCITECGGAMEVGKCNECGEQIGGTSHSLLSSNRLATAMDGARHAAWSNVMNMGNYRF